MSGRFNKHANGTTWIISCHRVRKLQSLIRCWIGPIRKGPVYIVRWRVPQLNVVPNELIEAKGFDDKIALTY